MTYGFHFGSIDEKTAVGIGSALDFNFGKATGTDKRYLNWSLLCGPAAKIHLTDSIKINANVGLGLLVIDHKFCGKSYENESFIGPAYNFELFIHPAQNEVFAFLLSSSGVLGLGEESVHFSSSVTAGFNISIGMGYFPYLFPFWVMAEG
ncbi:MAG: hypothetical protein HUK24_06525 [Sphaerochaetaceae bacterium]|nr:hypothetical protein [Sphaerochaetaceae bacterium]